MNYQKKNLKKVFHITDEHVLSDIEKKSLYGNILKKAKRKRMVKLIWQTSSIAALLVMGLLLFKPEDQIKEIDIREFAEHSQSIIPKTDDSIKIVASALKNNVDLDKDIQIYTVTTPESLHENNKEKYLTIYVPYGKRLDFNLPDGSTVWLNSGSYLTYNNDMEDEDREVYLNGEGFFNVTHTGRKFIVHTASSAIEVLGTSFNASSYEDEHLFSVELVTGKVQLTSNKQKYASFKMNAGESVMINTKTHKVEKSLGLNEDDILWTKKQLSLKNVAMRDVLKKMERIYNVQIYADKVVTDMNINYSGRLNVGVDIVTSLSSIYELNNYKIELKEKEVYITKK